MVLSFPNPSCQASAEVTPDPQNLPEGKKPSEVPSVGAYTSRKRFFKVLETGGASEAYVDPASPSGLRSPLLGRTKAPFVPVSFWAFVEFPCGLHGLLGI